MWRRCEARGAHSEPPQLRGCALPADAGGSSNLIQLDYIYPWGCARRGDGDAPHPLSARAQIREGGRCSHAPTFDAAVGAKSGRLSKLSKANLGLSRDPAVASLRSPEALRSTRLMEVQNLIIPVISVTEIRMLFNYALASVTEIRMLINLN